MNTCEYRLLKFLKNQTCINQRELAELLGYSLGKVNASLRMLLENGYVNDFTDERHHHEIYLSDPRKVAPERCKTVIRHPIKKL